jgi:predicted nicotinamide N-methyase
LGAAHVYITDGDSDTMENLRENVRLNQCNPSKVSCPQLVWGGQYPDEKANSIIAADLVYTIEMLEPLWETVSSVLAPNGVFVLSFTRRGVPIDLVFEFATKRGFIWNDDGDGEGIISFFRKEPEIAPPLHSDPFTSAVSSVLLLK